VQIGRALPNNDVKKLIDVSHCFNDDWQRGRMASDEII
jgi:hypothetical protein